MRLMNSIKLSMISLLITGLLCCIWAATGIEELFYASGTSIAVSTILVLRMILMYIIGIFEGAV